MKEAVLCFLRRLREFSLSADEWVHRICCSIAASSASLWDCTRATTRIRTTIEKRNTQHIMSKADTPVNNDTVWTVLEVAAYISTRSDSEITKGINHAIKITIPGRLSRMNDGDIAIPSQGANLWLKRCWVITEVTRGENGDSDAQVDSHYQGKDELIGRRRLLATSKTTTPFPSTVVIESSQPIELSSASMFSAKSAS